jgi:hypothetical protein
MKLAGRVALILLTALFFIGLTTAFERMTHIPSDDFRQSRELRRRAPEPRLARYPQVLVQFCAYVVLALIGRYVLRLRL